MAINKITDKPIVSSVSAAANILITQEVTADGQTVEDVRRATLAQLADSMGMASRSAIAPEYNALTFPVSVGQPCWHEGTLYRAKQAIPSAESWTAAHWKSTMMVDEIADLESALDDMQAADGLAIGKVLSPKTISSGKVIDWKFISNGGGIDSDETKLVHYYFPDLSDGGYSGHSALVVTPEKTLVMDCGPTTDWVDIKAYYDKLYAAGVFTNIDYIVLSHYHYDHYQNMKSILQTYPHVGCKVLLPMRLTGYRSDAADFDTTINGIISKIEAENCEWEIIDEITTIDLDEDGLVSMELFNSTPEDYAVYSALNSDYNNYSMVALIRHGSVYTMFPGDIQIDAQNQIMATRELPRLFLYSIHHHGIESEDNHAYLMRINPEYNVIMTSHNRMLVSAKQSSAGNFLTGKIGSTAYSAYHYVTWKNGGSLVDGIDAYRVGWYYCYQNYYVDNSYDGGDYNGTVEKPFTDINEALSFIEQKSNLHYRIYVKATSTRYQMLWIRDFNYPIEIIGQKVDGDCPTINGCYIRSCKGVSLQNLNFDSPGQESSWTTDLTELQVWSSDVTVMGCIFDGVNCPSGSDICGVILREATMYLTSGTIFRNLTTGITTDRYAGVTSNAITFTNVGTCYYCYVMDLAIRGIDKLTNVTKWIKATTGRTFAPDIPYGCYKTQHLALIDPQVVSKPFYVDSENPVCIIQGGYVRALDAPLVNGKILGISAKDDASESSQRTTTNSNGTTISNTSYNGSVTITQSAAPQTSSVTDYRNGYITIGVANMRPGKQYRFQADAEVTESLLSSNSVRVMPQGKTSGQASTDITDGKIDCIITYQQDSSHPTFSFIELHLGGKSMVLSNITITPT